jgi:hypothetical protein
MVFSILFIAFWMLAIKRGANSIKVNPESLFRLMILLFIAAHSLMDFNFSYGFVLALAGLVAASENGPVTTKEAAYTHRIIKPICVFIFCTAVVLNIEVYLQYRIETAVKQNNYSVAMRFAEQKYRLNPLDSIMAYNIAAIGQKNGKDNDFVLEWLNKSAELSPHDPNTVKNKIQFFLDTGIGDFGELIKEYINMTPKYENSYAYAKNAVQQAFEQRRCTEQEQANILSWIEEKQREENVVDRNELLREIAE